MKAIGLARRAPAAASTRPLLPAGIARPANRLGTWQLKHRLANTGRLLIFRAAAAGDLGPGCYVLKTARQVQPRDDITSALLRREAAVAAELNQPNLVSVVGANLHGTPAHVVLPYFEGLTLRRLLASSDTLSVSFALAVVRQVASALAVLHAAGWLHNQARPEHVIVSPQGHATLIDLTQARRLASSECDFDGTPPAAPTYAAPERFASYRLTSAVDTYSLGVLLFEAITGRTPYVETSPSRLAAAHRQQAPPDVRRFRSDVSPDVGELLRRLLAKEPLRRPSDDQLIRWLAELEIEELSGAGF
jgi:eukaryotic-like serine/threonine-protein kinase